MCDQSNGNFASLETNFSGLDTLQILLFVTQFYAFDWNNIEKLFLKLTQSNVMYSP
jgi:hypothetical protein